MMMSFISCTIGKPASKKYFVSLMKHDKNIGLLPGGFEEATIYEHGKHRIFIKNRMGFIKYALQYGYTVWPGYTFGEELTYHSFTWGLKWRIMLNRYKIPAVIFIGKWGLGYIPDWDQALISVCIVLYCTVVFRFLLRLAT
jgi:hypothetical protein